MAFSMFCRNPVLTNVFRQQVMRLATQASAQNSVAAHPLLATQLSIKQSSVQKPILEAVRSFRTSAVRLSGEKPHDHAKLWVIEKGVSAALVPLIPIALIMPNKLTDSLLAILVTAHSFWGLEAIAVDYVRATIFGPVIPKIAIGLVYLISIATLGGLFFIISHDVGIGHAIRQLWAIKSDTQKA